MRLFLFALESDEDVSDESDDEGSGSGFTYGSFVSSCFETISKTTNYRNRIKNSEIETREVFEWETSSPHNKTAVLRDRKSSFIM